MLHICMHTHIYTHTNPHRYLYTHSHSQTHTFTPMHVNTHSHTWADINAFMRTHAWIHVHTHACIHAHTCMHSCAHTCTCIYIYIVWLRTLRLTLEKSSLWLLQWTMVGWFEQANTWVASPNKNWRSTIGLVPKTTFFPWLKPPGQCSRGIGSTCVCTKLAYIHTCTCTCNEELMVYTAKIGQWEKLHTCTPYVDCRDLNPFQSSEVHTVGHFLWMHS